MTITVTPAITSAQNVPGLGTALTVIATVTLVVLLALHEIVGTLGTERAAFWTSALSTAIWPLMFVFAITIAARIVHAV